jgi:hypothetical protein
MKPLRQVTVVVAFATWIYCWTLLHGASSFYAPAVRGGLPEWLAAVVGLALFATIGTVVIGMMRLPVWPWLAIVSAVLVLASTIGVQFAELRTTAEALTRAGDHPRAVTILLAVKSELKHGTSDLIFFIVAPIMLAATGIMGWRFGPRHVFLPEDAHGA